jgi:Integrase zinc binding domain
MKDNLVNDMIKALKEKGTPPIKLLLSNWKVENGLLFFNDRCYVPDDTDLQRQLVEKYHYSLPGGHPGQWQTTELLWRDYWWPGMVTFVKNFVKGCTDTSTSHIIPGRYASSFRISNIKSIQCSDRP